MNDRVSEKRVGARRHTCPVFAVVFINRDNAAEGSKLDEIGYDVEDRVGHYATKTRQVRR